MKKKLFTLLITSFMITVSASSQTIRENIDKMAKDKDTKDRAAKADVLMQKKTISDTTRIIITTAKVVSKTPAVSKVKHIKNKYKSKYKKPSK